MLRGLLLLVAAFAAGVLAVLWVEHRRPTPPAAAALVVQVREVLRLETAEATLYKKVNFDPAPTVQDTAWNAVLQWARFALRPPHGRALVFAKVHLGYDLQALDASRLRVEGGQAEVALPPLRAEVELLPGETEVFDSNLDSAQTAELLELAKVAFLREALADPALRAQVERSARSSLQALLFPFGFSRVRVLGEPPAGPAL